MSESGDLERVTVRKAVTHIFSDTSSNMFISLVERPHRLNSGATVTAVTWPCHSLSVPSALPITGKRW